MTKWVLENNLRPQERERIQNGNAFLPTKELKKTTGLPEIAITQAVYDIGTDKSLGRDYQDVYPRGYRMPGEVWAGPNLALKYAKQYLQEALDYFDPKDAELKVKCIKSAELLLMHSCFAEEWDGSSESWKLLGEIYYNDWANGDYWFGENFFEYPLLETYPKLLKIKDFRERAYYCLKKGQSFPKNDAEAGVLLGECYLYGIGTKSDHRLAFKQFSDIWKSVLNSNARVVGRCALNIATCYEYGLGITQSFKEALSFYEKSCQSYDLALNQGEDLLEKFLIKAEKGLNRCKQELGEENFGFRHSFRARRYCD